MTVDDGVDDAIDASYVDADLECKKKKICKLCSKIHKITLTNLDLLDDDDANVDDVDENDAMAVVLANVYV